MSNLPIMGTVRGFRNAAGGIRLVIEFDQMHNKEVKDLFCEEGALVACVRLADDTPTISEG